MSKVSCAIIKDLLPSYMEEICSEETKKFVKDHLEECEECRILTKMMQKTELVSKQTEQGAVDYMKKVRNHVKKVSCFWALIGLLGIGTAFILRQYGRVPVRVYYFVMPFFLIALHGILSDYSVKQMSAKWKIGIGSAVTILIGYSILLEFLCMNWVKSGSYPFELEPSKVGPFLSRQFWISILIQEILFLILIVIHIRKECSYQGGMDGCVLGICINLTFLSLLKGLDTVERFIEVRNQTLFTVLLEWGLIVGILYWIRKKRRLEI